MEGHSQKVREAEMTEHDNCKYNFWKWLITFGTTNKKVYWLLWGLIAAVMIAAFKTGIVGLF